MNLKEDNLKQWSEAQEAVRNTHNFYLFLFGYVVMTAYLHFIDLKDGSYDWAFYSCILMTFSLIWMALITFQFPLKNRMILKEMKKIKLNSKIENHGTQ